jgi:two-component system, OmpR family, phosphate regulon sensor histidine kinase PhoR
MRWLIFAFIAAAFAAVFLSIWRKWIVPWKRAEQLVDSITNERAPATFLLSANPSAQHLGLALEKLWNRQRELIERVHESEFSVQAILGAMLDGLVVLDEQRRIQMMNPAFACLLDREKIETGTPLFEMLRDAAVEHAIAETLRTGEPHRQALRITRALGETTEIEVSVVALRERSNRIRGAVLLFRDITQVRRAEQVRRDFVANVSHELRTPLSIFRGYLETLLEDPNQPPGELMRIFEVMEKHSNRLNLLVEDVLSLAQLEDPGTRLNFTEIYLPDFLAAILRDWQKRLDAKLLKSSLDVPDDLPVISADEHRLQEVIYNLLDNAVKYSHPEGKIRLRATRAGDSIRLAISDQGVGVPSRDLPRIFERFYRADKARSRELGGTGLGLSIVKHIVELHGGRVEAESELGQGTTISAILPIHPQGAAVSKPPN